MFRKTKTFLLFLVIAALGNIFPGSAAAQEDTSFAEKVAKLEGLRAEQDALGERWQANQDQLETLELQYDALDSQLTAGIGTLGNLRARAETLAREYDQKLPEFNRRKARLDARAEEQSRDAAAYNAQCDRTFDPETEAAALASCNAWYARGTAADEQVDRDIEQWQREVQAVEDPLNRAIEEHDTLFSELQKLEARQNELVQQALALEASSQELVEAGRRLDVLINEIERSLCRPENFSTAEAFKQCQMRIFDGGGNIQTPPPWSPIDMSPTDGRKPSPYDLDPNVVKPDWEEEEDDGGGIF